MENNNFERFYHIPKNLLKSRTFSPTEKLFITVALQYFNAGYLCNCNIKSIAKNTGLDEASTKRIFDRLYKDGFCYMEDGCVGLQYVALLQEGVLEPENLQNLGSALKSKTPKRYEHVENED